MKKACNILIIVLLIITEIMLLLLLIKQICNTNKEPLPPNPDVLINEEPYSAEETAKVIDFLKNRTGIVVFQFINCKWCTRAIPVFQRALEETEYNKDNVIFYNPYYIRKNETQEYKEIVSILSDYLSIDDSGNKKLYVPEVVFLKEGKVVAHKSDILEDYTDVEKDLTIEQQDRLCNIYKEYINLINK